MFKHWMMQQSACEALDEAAKYLWSTEWSNKVLVKIDPVFLLCH